MGMAIFTDIAIVTSIFLKIDYQPFDHIGRIPAESKLRGLMLIAAVVCNCKHLGTLLFIV